jgi:hypothetical protein
MLIDRGGWHIAGQPELLRLPGNAKGPRQGGPSRSMRRAVSRADQLVLQIEECLCGCCISAIASVIVERIARRAACNDQNSLL